MHKRSSVALVAVILIAACGDDDDEPAATEAPTPVVATDAPPATDPPATSTTTTTATSTTTSTTTTTPTTAAVPPEEDFPAQDECECKYNTFVPKDPSNVKLSSAVQSAFPEASDDIGRTLYDLVLLRDDLCWEHLKAIVETGEVHPALKSAVDDAISSSS